MNVMANKATLPWWEPGVFTGAQYSDSRSRDKDTTAQSPLGPAGGHPLQSRGRIYGCNACLVNTNRALAIRGEPYMKRESSKQQVALATHYKEVASGDLYSTGPRVKPGVAGSPP